MAQGLNYYLQYNKVYKSLNRKKKNIPEYCEKLEREASEMMRSKDAATRDFGSGQKAAVTDYKMRHGIGY